MALVVRLRTAASQRITPEFFGRVKLLAYLGSLDKEENDVSRQERQVDESGFRAASG